MSGGWPWNRLGLRRTDDRQAIRRAYAERLKAMDPDADIGGFEQLRHARDAALAQARAMRLAAHTAASLADEPGAALDAGAALPDDDAGERDGDALSGFEFGAVDLSHDGHAMDDTVRAAAEPRAPPPDQQLAELIFPDGEHSEEAMSWEEFGEADALTDRMLADAQAGDITDHQRFDYWFGEVLAQGWPRSAPLLEKVSIAFGWMEESGAISERPALQFLNARLRGMRFHDKVTQPSHPLHKVWVELSRPGRANVFDRLRVGHDDIHTLLGGIRQRYPELESFLSAERVASWEGRGGDSSGSGAGWVWPIIVAVFFVAQLARCGSNLPDTHTYAPPPVVVDTGASEATANRLAGQLFGPDTSLADVSSVSPALGARFEQLGEDAAKNDGDWVRQQASQYVRQAIRDALPDAPFDTLVQIRRLQRDTAIDLRAHAAANACRLYLETGYLPDAYDLPDTLQAREHELGRKLLDAGLLDPARQRAPVTRAMIPGWLIEDIAKSARVPPERVVAGMKHRDGNCTIEIAWLDQMVRQPGRVPADLLRLR